MDIIFLNGVKVFLLKCPACTRIFGVNPSGLDGNNGYRLEVGCNVCGHTALKKHFKGKIEWK